MTRKSIPAGRQPTYRSKLFPEHEHDAYKSSAKLPTPTLCPLCGAVFAAGRWQWLARPEGAHSELCPACHRTQDRFPAGYVQLEGEFVRGHRDELIELARNLEQRERAEHALQRIMDIADQDGALMITTTDIHLAHGIGEALHHAYKGKLDSHYNHEEKLLRVRWSR
jgi:hypothetical protein